MAGTHWQWIPGGYPRRWRKSRCDSRPGDGLGRWSRIRGRGSRVFNHRARRAVRQLLSQLMDLEGGLPEVEVRKWYEAWW